MGADSSAGPTVQRAALVRLVERNLQVAMTQEPAVAELAATWDGWDLERAKTAIFAANLSEAMEKHSALAGQVMIDLASPP